MVHYSLLLFITSISQHQQLPFCSDQELSNSALSWSVSGSVTAEACRVHVAGAIFLPPAGERVGMATPEPVLARSLPSLSCYYRCVRSCPRKTAKSRGRGLMSGGEQASLCRAFKEPRPGRASQAAHRRACAHSAGSSGPALSCTVGSCMSTSGALFLPGHRNWAKWRGPHLVY